MSEDKNAAATPEVAAAEFAPAVPPTTDEIADKLKEFGATDEIVAKVKDLGVDTVADISELTEADLVGAGLKIVKARKLLDAAKPAPGVASAAPSVVSTAAFDGLLPSVQDDESWIKALKTGGVSKVDTSTVIAAVRAALAKSVGLYEVPAKLVSAMEAFADESEEQVDPVFYVLRKQMTRRNYADIFAAVDGLDGAFVTDKRKAQLLSRLDQFLWPAIVSFDGQLKGWYESYKQVFTGPDALMALVGGLNGGGLAPGIMQAPPDTAVLQDAADTVKDAVNRVFAGTGVQIAAALAYEASEIKKSLEDSRLPALTGSINREQMLKKLGVAVPASYPRLETNLTKYVLAVMGLEDQSSGAEELRYLGALFMLGSQIDWTQFGGRSATLSRLGKAGQL